MRRAAPQAPPNRAAAVTRLRALSGVRVGGGWTGCRGVAVSDAAEDGQGDEHPHGWCGGVGGHRTADECRPAMMDRMRPVSVRMPSAATDPPTIPTIQVASAPPYHTAPACKASRTGRDPDVKEFG